MPLISWRCPYTQFFHVIAAKDICMAMRCLFFKGITIHQLPVILIVKPRLWRWLALLAEARPKWHPLCGVDEKHWRIPCDSTSDEAAPGFKPANMTVCWQAQMRQICPQIPGKGSTNVGTSAMMWRKTCPSGQPIKLQSHIYDYICIYTLYTIYCK